MLKLHTVINHAGERLSIRLIRGNSNDRKPLPNISEVFWAGFIQFLTGTDRIAEKKGSRENMKPVEYKECDRGLLRHSRGWILIRCQLIPTMTTQQIIIKHAPTLVASFSENPYSGGNTSACAVTYFL